MVSVWLYFSDMDMKMLFAASFAVILLGWTGCATGDAPSSESARDAEGNITFYGEVIDTEGGLDGPALRKALSLTDGRTQVRLEGEITATCPKKGCWMNVASGGDTVFVRYQDYGYFEPTGGAEGKRTIVEV